MPRSSRHKSHRQHRRNSSRGDVRERSDSDSEEERKVGDAFVSSSGTRDSGSEKRKSGLFIHGPEECNAVDVGNHGGKSADLFLVDRWGGEDGKEVTVDELGEEKVALVMEKAKGSGVGDWKKSSTRHDGSGGRKERGGSDWDESGKRRSERELSRSERSNQHSDVKERDREHFSDRDREYLAERRKDHDIKKDREHELEEREHRPEKVREHRQERDREHRLKRSREQLDDMDRERGLGREVTDVARERCNDPSNRKYGSRLGDCEHTTRGSQENTDKRAHEELHNADLDKDALKKVRRRDYHGDKEKRHEDDRVITERKLSMDDRVRNGSSKAEIYREERYREKYREDFDRDERPRYDKHRDSRSSRDYSSGRTDIKHSRDEHKQSENHNKKSRIEENGRGSSPYDEYSLKYRDNREKKRFSDVIDVHSDPKSENKEDPRMVESNIYDSYKFEVTDDRGRSEITKVKGSADSNRQVKSSNSSSQVVNNVYGSLEHPEATHVKLWCEEQQSLNPSGEPLSESTKCMNAASMEVLDTHKEGLHEVFMVKDLAGASQLQTTPSDGYSSPVSLSERVPSSSSGRRYSNKVDAVRHSGVVVESRSNNSRDGRGYPTNENKEQDLRQEKRETTNGNSQMDLPDGDSIPGGPVSCNKADPFSSCSPSPLRPSSSVRHSPASFSDGDRFQAGDRKSNSRYKRTGEINMGRGHGHAMKGVLSWPSPVPNGFIPFQHGPPPGGFYPVVQPFPAPMFGMRPQMDLKQSGNPFHMNENSDRFSGHCRPFGWRNPVDDPFPPSLQGWDGNNIFGDGSYMHCRSDWEQKNHLINNSSSEMSSEILKSQNGNTCLPYLVSDKETVPSMRVSGSEVWTAKSGHQLSNEQPEPEFKRGSGSGDNHAAKDGNEFSPKHVLGKKLVSSKLSDDSDAAFCSTCLSKLDISPDLASPELYGQWRKKVEIKGNEISDDDIKAKNDAGVMPGLGIFGRAERPLFPASSDDVFQRALSLYRKNNEAKTSTLSNPPSKEEMDTSEFSDADKIAPVEIIPSCKSNLPGTENTCGSMEEDANKLGEPTPVQVDPLHDADNLGEHKKVHQGDLPSVIQDGQSSAIYSAANCVAQDGQSNITYSSAGCAEGGPLGCEAIMQECSVNLNRIHHSPESTH